MSGACTESTIQTRYKTECFCFFVARAPLPAVRNYKSVPPHACDAGKNLGKASDANKNQGNAEAMLLKDALDKANAELCTLI